MMEVVKQFVTDVEWNALTHHISEWGGDELHSAEAVLPQDRLNAVYQGIAREWQCRCYTDHRALRSIEGHLLTTTEAGQWGVVPHREEFQTAHVLSSSPLTPLQPLEQRLGMEIQLSLVTPAVYRRVQKLVYVRQPWQDFTPAHALALCTQRHAALFNGQSIEFWRSQGTVTELQAAEAMAMTMKLPFVNVDIDPPDPDLATILSHSTQAQLRAYPYRRQEDALLVLVTDVQDDVLRLLRMTTQLHVRPVLTSGRMLDTLIARSAPAATAAYA